MTKRLFFLATIVVVSFCYLNAQEDSTHIVDSLQSSYTLEDLLEQSAEDSPILDVINNETHDKSSKSSVAVRSRMIQKIQESAGYTEGTYLGSSLKSYQRITAAQGDKLSAGMLIAKDAGERRFNEFTSWNLTLSNLGFLSKAVVGSYRIEAGQGIALWRGYDFSKGADVVAPVKKKARGLIASLSTDEVEYFKGGAANISIGSLWATMFYSQRHLSASVDTLGNVTTLYSSGYFRTESEQSKRDNLTEKLLGTRASYRFSDRDQIGATFYQTMFSFPLLFDEGKRFSGDRYSLLALDYNLNYRSMTAFGEWARVNSTIGGISGLFIIPNDDVTLVASIRSYPYQFISLHGLGFGERSSMYNEHGVYIGMRLRLMRSLILSSYYDQFTFPEATSVSRFATKGNDLLAELQASPFKKLTATVRYQRKQTEEPGDATSINVDVQRIQRIRLQIDYRFSNDLQLRGRAERVFLNWRRSLQSEQGLMIYQDVSSQSSKRLWWSVRVMFFQTDSYSTRIYAYERDLDGVLTLPALYGTGIRWYGLLRYTLSDKIELSAKYSDIIRDDVKHIGSGLDELPTNHDNRVGVQVDVRF